MRDKKEEIIKTIVGIFAIIGFLFAIIAISIIFNYIKNEKPETSNVCSDYEFKIEDLETEIQELQSNISLLEDENEHLQIKIDDWKNEYETLESAKGCDYWWFCESYRWTKQSLNNSGKKARKSV